MPAYAFDLDTETWVNYDPEGTDVQVEVGLDLDFGHPVYTRAWIDGWSTSDPGYTPLASSYGGNNSRVITSYGTAITTTQRRNDLRDDSVYAKCQAALWAADGSTTRRNKVIEVLEAVKNVTVYETQPGQDNLVAGWFATNLCQAAAIVGYEDASFSSFLRDVIYPMLDWPTGGNWHASFADSRLAIAAYLKDPALWVDARSYLFFRLPQTIYHSAFDGSTVVPLRGGDWPQTQSQSPHLNRTQQHWGGVWGASQVGPGFAAVYEGVPLPDGCDAERVRDLSHPCMGLTAWQQALHTLIAQGDTIPAPIWDRIVAAADYHAQRVLHYENTGTMPDPAPVNGTGGNLGFSWWGLRRLLGDDCPESVHLVLQTEAVTGLHPAGANHTVAERFCDSGGE